MLKENGRIKKQKRIRGLFYRFLGKGLWLAGIILFAMGMGNLLKSDIILILVILCIFLGFLSLRYAKKLLAQDAPSLLSKDRRRPVLLLRSYKMDDDRLLGESGTDLNFEQTLVYALSHIGPVITVGRPTEHLAPIGAARLYISSENWQTGVQELMCQARIVVLVLFTYDSLEGINEAKGFRWEIQYAISQIDRKKLLLVLPAATKLLVTGFRFGAKRKMIAIKSSFKVFFKGIQTNLPFPIPDNFEEAQFLCFNSHGRPQLLRAHRMKKGITGFIDALQPFFKLLQLPSPSTKDLILLELHANTWLQITLITVLCGLIAFYISQLK